MSQPGKGEDQEEGIGQPGDDDEDTVPDLLDEIAPPSLTVAKQGSGGAAAFDFGPAGWQAPAKEEPDAGLRLNKLNSKVNVDPPLEEYPDVIFRKANSDSDRDDVLVEHP